MPVVPEPKGAAPDLMPFLRWVRQTLIDMIAEQARRQASDKNTNASQNSTMSTLVDRLGTVESIMDSIGSSLTIDSSQVISGVLALARIPILDVGRIPDLDVSKITTGTWPRGVSTGSDVSGNNISGTGHGTFNAAWNYDVSAITRRAVWMDSSGRMGQTSSSETFKTNIKQWAPNETAVRLLKLVTFNWRPELGPNWHHEEVGLIAQQVHNLGLRWLVSYEADGKTPHSIHYERLALALLPLTQRLADEADSLREEGRELHARLEAIEKRLASLEENN